MGSAVAIEDLDEPGGGIDAQLVAGAEDLCHIPLEAVDQRHAPKGRALRQDRVDPVEDQRPRHDATRGHLMQHPGGGDPALGGVENQNAVSIALPGELMARAREYPLVTVEVVARAEI